MRVWIDAVVVACGIAWTCVAWAESSLPPCPPTGDWNSCIGSQTLSNGQTYLGEFRGGKRNGQGTYTWPNGMKYVGEFRDGKRNGQGTHTWSDGMTYVG